MKKYLSLVLAVVMLFTVCIPAFAAEIKMGETELNNGSAEKSGTSDVFTKTTDEKGKNPASYTVIIPADTLIQWGDPYTEFKYSIKSQLEIGQCLNISVIGENNEDKLLSSETSDSIPYQLSYNNEGGTVNDALSYKSAQEIVDLERKFFIRVTDASWDSVPLAVYKDSLTFQIDVIDIVTNS